MSARVVTAVTPINLLKIIGGPGSLGFFAVAFVVGCVLIYVWPRRPTFGCIWLTALCALYLLLGFPPVAQFIARDLIVPLPSRTSPAYRVDELVVLAGDNEHGRVAEAVTASKTLKPHTVVVLGRRDFAQRIADAGVDTVRIRQNDSPGTTREQMEWIVSELREHPDWHIAVVASRLHMPRVSEITRQRGIHVLLLPSPLDEKLATAGVQSFFPTHDALFVSRDALYERAALAYYRARGWIQSRP